MTKTTCIIQARIKSTRLPAKTMLILPTGHTVVQKVVWRCFQIEGIDKVVLAIPDSDDCDILVQEASRISHETGKECFVFRGSELDVLSRYYHAWEAFGGDHIMRITADCPCLDPEVCSQVLKMHLQRAAGYSSNVWPRTYPQGYDCEVFTKQLLLHVHRNDTRRITREHVTTPMAAGRFCGYAWRVSNLTQEKDESEIRLTLDTIDDYIRICHHMLHETRRCVPDRELREASLRPSL